DSAPLQHCCFNGELGNKPILLGRPSAAHLNQFQIRASLAQLGKHIEQHVDAFSCNATADVQEETAIANIGREQIVFGPSLRSELRGYSIGCMDENLGVDQVEGLDLPANGFGGVEDNSGLL